MCEDVRAARQTGRLMIAWVLMVPLFAVFWWFAQPGTMGGGWVEPWYASILPWAGWSAYATGVIWMIRIHRTSHLEPETSSWRYRER
jgi:hypothetical protein